MSHEPKSPTVREYLSEQSFSFQREFGLKVLRQHRMHPP